MGEARGPSWVGIGAQRSGTTWFTNLLLEHPSMTLAAPSAGRGAERKIPVKELHFFDEMLLGLPPDAVDRYQALFEDRLQSGEFTPAYLRYLWVPPMLRVAAPNAVLLALLRDPVDRFESAMRWRLSRQARRQPNAGVPVGWIREQGGDAVWAGMYATQLRVWRTALPDHTLLVFQYEAVRAAPQAAVDRVWRALALEPVALEGVRARSETSTSGSDRALFTVDMQPDLPEVLHATYELEVLQLEEEWGIDVSLWPNFST